MSKYDYEDDMFDEDEQGEENEDDLSPEDQKQMNNAIKLVSKTVKGTSVTDAQIRDAVWNYYFDVDKSVKFLQDQLRKQESSKPKPKTKKGWFDFSSLACSLHCSCFHCEVSRTRSGTTKSPRFRVQTRITVPASCLFGISSFKGINWGLPACQNTELTYCGPKPMKLGLLGGSSKLAALAKARAAKRQQAQQQQAQPMEDIEPASSSASSEPDTPVLASKRLTDLLAERSKLRTPSRSRSPEKRGSLRQAASSSPPTTTSSEWTANLCGTSEKFAPCSPSTFASSLLHKHDEMNGTSVRYNGLSASEVWKIITNNSFFYLPVNEAQAAEIKHTFNQPSPDDLIKLAQTTKGGTSGGNRRNLAQDMKSLSIEPKPVKQPKVDVIQKYKDSKRKPHVNFVVIGHVDAGKSTLMGRLLYDIKAVDERTIQKYRHEAGNAGKASFAFAWVLDQSEEERERGVTMDVAMNSFESDNVDFTILDAPGHADFVPNMIAGASEADFAVLVVDSSPNEFERGFVQGGQTKEHALLVRALGVQYVIVAVNKLDNVQWSQFRYDEIKESLLTFFAVAGFAEKQITFVPCSGLSGDNIVHKSTLPDLEWYTGRTLLGELENLTSVQRDITAPLRLSVTNVFKVTASSSVNVSARLNAGTVQIGETVLAVPSMETAVVKSIMISDQPTEWAVAGDNVQIALSQIEFVHVRPGDVLCAPASPVWCAQAFTARVILFKLRVPLIKGSNVLIYRGRTTEAAKITKLVAVLDKSTGKVTKSKPRHLISGQTATLELEILGGGGTGFPLETFKANKDLGRIVLRQDGITVGAGVVDQILSRKVTATE
ncbi:hypothetical protein V1512DRAFT_263450 [Lipomyces arxii]|uniref:uncharacterized protein n=1 Tax=Lipomyces arxii TaxID=56418 RepID=UPI0034CFA4E5